jgi:hypothetical protein
MIIILKSRLYKSIRLGKALDLEFTNFEKIIIIEISRLIGSGSNNAGDGPCENGISEEIISQLEKQHIEEASHNSLMDDDITEAAKVYIYIYIWNSKVMPYSDTKIRFLCPNNRVLPRSTYVEEVDDDNHCLLTCILTANSRVSNRSNIISCRNSIAETMRDNIHFHINGIDLKTIIEFDPNNKDFHTYIESMKNESNRYRGNEEIEIWTRMYNFNAEV